MDQTITENRKVYAIMSLGEAEGYPMEKAWSRPELIVLVRQKPEEAVLQNCKGGTPGGAYQNNLNCSAAPGIPTQCGECQALGAS